MIRVAVVERDALVRAGLARILAPGDGFEVVAACSDNGQALEELPSGIADVILVGVWTPGLGGIAAISHLCQVPDSSPVLAVASSCEDEVLWGAIEAGASGFLLKDSSLEDLVTAVRVVAGGGVWFAPAVVPRVLDRYRRLVAPAIREAALLDLLTGREHAVLRLMARGATNAEIAARLYVAEATVKTHVRNIFRKLNVRDRPAAIVFAYDHAVVCPGAPPVLLAA